MIKTIQTDNFLELFDPKRPIASFDVDHTVIYPEGKKRTYNKAKGSIWEFNPGMVEKIRQVSKTHTVIFVTNRRDTDSTTLERVSNMMDIINIPSKLFIPLEYDCARKPGIGMVTEFKFQPGSFHCGDAANRNLHFSDDDFWFAYNLQIGFFEPEEFLKFDFRSPIYPLPKIPSPHIDTDTINILETIYQNFQGILIMGLPGSGKSYLRNWFLERYPNILVFNSDSKLCPKKVLDSDFVVLDNTNLTIKSRNNYPKEILTRNLATIFLDLSPKECLRGIKYRMSIGGDHIPDVTVYSLNKYRELPSNIDFNLNHRPILTKDFPPYLIENL